MTPVNKQYGWSDAFKDLWFDFWNSLNDKIQFIENDFLRNFTLGFIAGIPLFAILQTIVIVTYAIATDFVW